MKEKISNTKMMWKEVDAALIKEKGEVLTSILEEGRITASPKKLVSIFSEFFQTKVKKICDSFTPTPFHPINILNKLIQKPDCTFSLNQSQFKDPMKSSVTCQQQMPEDLMI